MSAPIEAAPQLVKDAMKRFQLAQEAEQEFRREALDDLKFLSGEQWPDAIKKQRESDGRPCLTINRLRPALKQVTNEQRQNRPAIQVSPVGDGADEETAEILQGLVRHIEDDSDADVAYDTALYHASATGGPGWIRIDPEYEEDDDGPQVLKINRVRNSFIVYDDPSAQKADRSDSKWRFFVENLTKDEYKMLYPKGALAGLDDWASVGDQVPGWLSEDSVRIAEYFYFEGKQLKWCKINAVEVLDETDIDCKWIPSSPVFGEELEIDGKLTFSGIVRDAKDPQRMYNFWASKETEAIALAPNAPWVGAAGQFKNFEGKWGSANTKNWAYLEYNQVDVGNKPAPPPQRQVAEPAVQAITQARVASSQDLEATTGVYPAQLGAPSDEKSGKAILARQQQGHLANFDLTDNLRRSLKHVGRIIIDMIPSIYREKGRVVQIIREDDSTESVTLNKKFKDPDGISKIYDATTGRYAVAVSTGPSYQTRRKEAAESMMALTSANPALLNIAGDLMVKSMDWPYADKVAERMKKMLPPQLQDDDGTPEAKLAQAQAQLQQLGMQHQQLVQVVQQQTDIIKSKQVEAAARTQQIQMQEMSRQSIVKMQEATKLAVAQMNASKDANQQFAEQELKQYEIMHESAHDLAMQHVQHQNAMELGQQQADNAQTQQLTQIGADQQAQEAQSAQSSNG